MHDITLSILLCTVCPSIYKHGMNSSIQMYVILPCPYVHTWYVLICMYVVFPLMYEYKLLSMVWVIIRLSTIVRVSKHAQVPPVDIDTIWTYIMKNQEQVKTTSSP